MNRTRSSLLVFALLLMAPRPVPARQSMGPYEDLTERPASPAGQRALEVLDVVNSGDPGRVRAFIEGSFEPKFRDAFPMEEHLGIFAEVYDQSRGYDFHSVRRYRDPRPDGEIVLIVRNRLTEGWEGIIVNVEPRAPHRVTGLSFAPARPPTDLPAPGKLSEAQIIDEARSFVQRMADAGAFSGTVLLARHGEILYSDAAGEASKRFAVPNRLDTKFNLGSMNKMFTAVAIARLVERGRMSFEDPIDRYLGPEWLAPGAMEGIKVRHLLNHTSGLGSYFNEKYEQSSRQLFRKVSDYQPLVAEDKPQFPPGSEERYSNTGFLLLGAIIEKVSGEDYFEFVRRNVYEPAGMVNTDCYEMDRPVPNLAIGYTKQPGPDGDPQWRNNLYMHVIKGGPAGGGFSTVEDLLRFDQAMRDQRLVSSATAQVLWTPKPNSPGYGYGFAIDQVGGDRVVGHGGGFPGISGQLDMYLDSGYTVAVLSNYDGAAQLVSRKLRQLLERRK